MKIVYCTDSICYQGGIAMTTITKANALAGIPGNEVWVAVTDNKGNAPIIPLIPNVHLVDLDVNYYEDDWKSKLHVLKGIFLKRRQHKKKLRNFLGTVRPDIVVSTGTSEKLFLPYLKKRVGGSYIREIHFTKSYRRLAACGLFEKLSASVGDILDYQVCIRHYDKVVVLTEEDRVVNWHSKRNVEVIANPIEQVHDKESLLENETVITAGRLVLQKNFSSLIDIWKKVNVKHPDWKLEIWGEGTLRNTLQQQIASQNLASSVFLMGYSDNIGEAMSKASIYVCSSSFEGFGLAIVEAMSHGVPVVSYGCPCGPKDIIEDGKCGYIVPVGAEEEFADRICTLIENYDLRKRMGRCASERAADYSVEKITAEWMRLFNELSK
ncbi:MAG: glycosyltransferase family 4 protein [Bacteroidales bacterium]|nr:glycosyltransferase family 4 protein [Bacteroidales bacterium]